MDKKRAPLRQHFQNEANKAESLQLHAKRTAQLTDFESTVIDGFNALIKFMNGQTTKTEVVNQLKSISTPDVDKLIPLLSKLDDDVRANKVDFSLVLKELQQIKRETSLLPKSLPKFNIPEQKDTLKVSNLSEIKLDTTNLEKAVKALKLDPTIEVKAADVHVDAPDLKPIKDVMLDLLKAVKGQKYPEMPEITPTDLTKVEKKLDTSNDLLKTISEKRFGGGGGGGGNGTPYVDSEGIAKNVVLNPDGSIPVTATLGTTNYTTRIEEDSGDSNITYIGKAAIGSATSSAVWQIQKIDETTGMVITWGGTGAFDNIWNNRESLSYS